MPGKFGLLSLGKASSLVQRYPAAFFSPCVHKLGCVPFIWVRRKQVVLSLGSGLRGWEFESRFWQRPSPLLLSHWVVDSASSPSAEMKNRKVLCATGVCMAENPLQRNGSTLSWHNFVQLASMFGINERLGSVTVTAGVRWEKVTQISLRKSSHCTIQDKKYTKSTTHRSVICLILLQIKTSKRLNFMHAF